MKRILITGLMLLILVLTACTGGQETSQIVENDVNQSADNGVEAGGNQTGNLQDQDEADADNVNEEEGGEEASSTDLTFVDGMDRTVVLQDYPQRVISISASTTEIIFALGAGDTVIGRDTFSIYPPEVEAIEVIGDFFGSVPSEALLAAEPDLVLAGGIISQEQINTIEALGLTVYYQLDPTDFDGLYTNILDIGELLGYQEAAAALVESLAARVDSVVETLAEVEEKPVVFVELDGSDPASPWTTGSGTFVDYILSAGGGQNAASDLTGAYAQMSIEALIEVNPDVILLTDALYGVTPESVAERAGWEAIAAVENGAVYPFDPYLFNVPGPRLVDGLEEVARLLHPDLFE